MAEAVRGYPRWEGALARTPRALVIARREWARTMRSVWARGALTLAFAYAIVTVGNLYTLRESPGVHTTENFASFLELLSWAGLALAAVAAGPALLEDAQRGALELYHARAVTRADYLAGKALAVAGLAFAATAGPALVYWLGSFLAFDEHPDLWGWAGLGAIGYGALWALVVAGLGLGLSAVARSSRVAVILLFGGVAVLDILFGRVLTAITRDETLLVLSPLADMAQQTAWLLATDAPYAFPWPWGLAALGVLLVAGWGLVAWRHPRLRGVERP